MRDLLRTRLTVEAQQQNIRELEQLQDSVKAKLSTVQHKYEDKYGPHARVVRTLRLAARRTALAEQARERAACVVSHLRSIWFVCDIVTQHCDAHRCLFTTWLRHVLLPSSGSTRYTRASARV